MSAYEIIRNNGALDGVGMNGSARPRPGAMPNGAAGDSCGYAMREHVALFRAAIQIALPNAIVPDSIEPGRMHRFSSNGRRGDTAGWAKLFEDGRGGVFGDFRTGLERNWSAAGSALLTPAEKSLHSREIELARMERQVERERQMRRNAARIDRLWAECKPLTIVQDPVSHYLSSRGFNPVFMRATCLRFHDGLDYWHDGQRLGQFPAMVAPLLDKYGRMVALHRTYLTPEGRKAPVPQPRKLTSAAGVLKGAFIPLREPIGDTLGVAEGIDVTSRHIPATAESA